MTQSCARRVYVNLKSNSLKRILVLTHFYPPETGAASHRVSAFARRLASRGHDVTVLTSFPSWPTGQTLPAYRKQLSATMRDDGLAVHMVWAYVSNKFTRRSRILNMVTAALSMSLWLLLRRRPFDVVCVSSPPITLVLPALLARMLSGAPLICDLRDIYPEVAVRLGEWKEKSFVVSGVRKLAAALYQRATLIVCVTKTCRETVLGYGVNPKKIVVIPNGFDALPLKVASPYVASDGEFVVSYTGNLGSAIGAGILIEAARALKSDRRFTFILVGDGADRRMLQNQVNAQNLHNVTMLGALSRAQTYAVQSISDVCVVPLRSTMVDSLPTKMIDAMALGRPVLVSANGEARDFVEKSGGGVAVAPEAPEELANMLVELASNPQRLAEYSRCGQEYVRKYYDRALLADTFCDYVASAVVKGR